MVDLHVHTTASDGVLSPSQVVEEAKHLGLSAIAITDHDTTAGLGEALEAGRTLGLEVAPGVEINAEENGKDVHILGYFIPYQDEGFEARLRTQREARVQRLHKMLAKLDGLGVHLSPEEVLSRLTGKGGSVGRPHVAQSLLEAGYVESVDAAFVYFLGRNAPAYVPREGMSCFEATALIRQFHGIPVLAHPGLLNRDELLSGLLTSGLMGLEAYYPRHDERTTQKYKDKAKTLGLLLTGGSDFHGWESEDMVHLGEPGIEDAVYEALKAKAGR